MTHTHEHHEHHEHHHHHHHTHAINELNSIYIVAVIINLLFVGIEAGVGFWGNSLGLLSDAGHNLGDVFSLLLAFFAFKLAATHANKHFTYGYKKSSVLISLVNAIILLVAVGAIVLESIHKFSAPTPINGTLVAWTAGIGILVNGITAWMLHRQSHHDINTKGAYLHMLADTLVSVGVLLSGIIINITGLTIIDPIISLIIAVVILISTWNLLTESIRLCIDAVPEHIEIEDVKRKMEAVAGIQHVHHLHIWPISTTEIALTAHIEYTEEGPHQLHDLKQCLHELGIQHTTIEVEDHDCTCGDCGF